MAIHVAFEKHTTKPITAFIQLLKNFFSRKDVSVLCLLLAILFRCAMTFYLLQLDADKLFQAIAAKHQVEGHGITIKQVHVSNLSKANYEPLIGWPPGYTLIVSLIYPIVNNLDVSCFIIDIFSIVFFFVALRLLLKQLQFPAYLINLLLLFNGLTITDYMLNSTPTDLLSMVFCLYNCYFAIALFRQKDVGIKGVLL